MDKKSVSQLALRFVLIIGVVNLFADFTYEGARSVNGAFLASLGASAIVDGFVGGFGELIGYGLRGRCYLAFALACEGSAQHSLVRGTPARCG
ncbi:MAG: hypothetical protein ABSF15_14855 [Candidatus Sulfotelmatobacter sp.]|jgi:hypothetical protein